MGMTMKDDRRHFTLTRIRLSTARRRYVKLIERSVIENHNTIFTFAKRAQQRGLYSEKTSLTDIVFSIFRKMLKNAKERGEYSEFCKYANESGLFGIWRQRYRN